MVRGRKGEYAKLFEDLRAEGFSRVRVDGEVRSLDDPIDLDKKFKHDIEVVVDRIVIRQNSLGRIAESVEQATALAHGNVNVYMLPDRDAPEEPRASCWVFAGTGVPGARAFHRRPAAARFLVQRALWCMSRVRWPGL